MKESANCIGVLTNLASDDPGITVAVHRDLIITLAARHRLPAVYGLRSFVTAGGRISYGADAMRPRPKAPQ
jgi:hypothetical protein